MKLYNKLIFRSELNNLAKSISDVAKTGDIIAISGDIGVGKTTLAGFIISNFCNFHVNATSPTFNICKVYQHNGRTVYHFDLYRVHRYSELIELGLDDAMENGLIIVEWPDMIKEVCNRINICIEFVDGIDDARRVNIELP